MDTAVVLQSYDAFGAQTSEGSQDLTGAFGGPTISTSRMAQKRRRLDDPAGEYGSPSGTWEVAQQQRQQTGQPYGSSALFGATSHPGDIEYTGRAASAASGGDNAGTTLTEGSDIVQWQGASGVSPYPDVSSYSQQPYFFQQTHPSAYNSPWPPGGEAASFATRANVYPSTSASSTSDMPFFPSNNQVESGEFGNTSNLQQALVQHGFPVDGNAAGATSAQFSYASGNEHGVPRSDVPPEASAFLYEDASMHLKIKSLTILENLATQLIHTIAKASFPQIQEIMRGNDDEDSQAYTTLKSLFDHTRKVYSRETPFIDAIAIQMFQPNQQEIIRKANIATFLSSILGAHDVSFFHLNEFFMETFVPLGHRLLKWQGAVYLELKTQTYISALINSDGSPESMLDELFPPDLDAQILTRHPDAPSLSPSEQDFIDRSRQRRNYLLAEGSTAAAIQEFPKKYGWQEFVREFALSISKNVEGIMNTPTRSLPAFGANGMDKRTTAAAAALDTMSQRSSGGAALSGVQALNLNGSTGQAGSGGQSRDDNKRSSTAASTVRQPWTKPEEDALLSGLERVNGPHWSQILALYGRGGSVSEVLKDRNQVQLKDKARNLKLWYLKMGKEVPPALRGVTGELRKRGGARARAALGVGDDDEQEDVEGEVEMDGSDPGASQTARSGRVAGRRKSKKGS